MSLHIIYTHQCSNCEAYYLPYAKDIKCPNCGLDEEEVFDVISELVRSANYQKSIHGFYTPLAWWNGSYADHVALYLFQLFDSYYEQKEKDFEQFSLDYINSGEWNNQEYAKAHIYDIACQVFLQLKKES
jgi:hypothetical protein